MSQGAAAVQPARRALSLNLGGAPLGVEVIPAPAAIYARVSTVGRPGRDKYGLDAQEEACRRGAPARRVQRALASWWSPSRRPPRAASGWADRRSSIRAR